MGLSVTVNSYLRNCYSNDRTLCKKDEREKATNGTLSFADSMALRKSINALKDIDFSNADEKKLSNNLTAFIDCYNYTLDSASKSQTQSVKSAAKQMRSLSKEYEDELKKLGISIDEKKGYLSLSSSATQNISSEKFESLFGRSSSYLSSLNRYAGRIKSHVDIQL